MLRKIFSLIPWIPCCLVIFSWIAYDIQTNNQMLGIAMFAIMGIGIIHIGIFMLLNVSSKMSYGKIFLINAQKKIRIFLYVISCIASCIYIDMFMSIPKSRTTTFSATRFYCRDTYSNPTQLPGKKELYRGRLGFKPDDTTVADRLYILGKNIFRPVSVGERVTLTMEVADSALFGRNTYFMGISLKK